MGSSEGFQLKGRGKSRKWGRKVSSIEMKELIEGSPRRWGGGFVSRGENPAKLPLFNTQQGLAAMLG